MRRIAKEKLVTYLISLITHDFGFYNPKWKWSLLPSNIKDNYDLLEKKLKEWEIKGYIKQYEENGERILEIISIPDA